MPPHRPGTARRRRRQRHSRDQPLGLLLGALALAAVGGALLLAGLTWPAAGCWLAAATAAVAANLSSLRMDLPPANVALASRTSPSVHIGLICDLTLLGLLRWQGRRTLSQTAARAQAEELDQFIAWQAEQGFEDRPAAAHSPPSEVSKVDLQRVRRMPFGSIERLEFASEFEPLWPGLRSDWAADRANQTVCVHLLRHDDRPRPAIIVVHGYQLGRFHDDALALTTRGFGLGWLRKLGLDVALITLPFHGPRRVGGWSANGHGFFDRTPLHTQAALAQSALDVRRLAGWLRQQGAPMVGLVGMSLGGLVAALVASLERDFRAAVAVIPAVDIARTMWRPLGSDHRKAVERAGLTYAKVERALWTTEPLRLQPRVAPEARFIVGGSADRIVPPAHVDALWEWWGRGAIYWYGGAHMGWSGRRGVQATLEAHLRATLLTSG